MMGAISWRYEFEYYDHAIDRSAELEKVDPIYSGIHRVYYLDKPERAASNVATTEPQKKLKEQGRTTTTQG